MRWMCLAACSESKYRKQPELIRMQSCRFVCLLVHVCMYRCWCQDLSLRKRNFVLDIVSHSTLENWYLDIGNRLTVLEVHSFLAFSISKFDKVCHKSLHLMFLHMWHEAPGSGEEPRCVYPCLFVALTHTVFFTLWSLYCNSKLTTFSLFSGNLLVQFCGPYDLWIAHGSIALLVRFRGFVCSLLWKSLWWKCRAQYMMWQHFLQRLSAMRRIGNLLFRRLMSNWRK